MNRGRIAKVLALFTAVVGGAALGQHGAIDMEFAATPDEINYGQLAQGPPGVLSAMLVGDPFKPGVYVLRNKFPPDFTLPPHKHQEWRVMTVLEGTVYFGYGESVNEQTVRAFGPGSLIVEPKNVWHYFQTKGEGAVIQFVAEGPLTAAMAPL